MWQSSRTTIVLVALTACVSVFGRQASDCPEAAAAKAVFEVVEDTGRTVPGATVLFTAKNWDSTVSQLSDSSGRVTVSCVPAGHGYDVTVLYSGYAAAHVSARASAPPEVTRVHLQRLKGRYVRVTHGGGALPGVTVAITDSNGEAQLLQTDTDGFAHFAELKSGGDAVMELALEGFISQRARVNGDFKNGPLLFELAIVPVCTPMQVH
jgi:hypothetical protein